ADKVPLLRDAHELFHLLAAHRRRLLHEHVLAGLERALRELVVGRYGCGDNYRLEAIGREHLVEVRGDSGLRVAGGKPLPRRDVEVADPGEPGELVEVAREVRPPVAKAGQADLDQSFQTFSDRSPAPPVAFRRSTTSLARSTTPS